MRSERRHLPEYFKTLLAKKEASVYLCGNCLSGTGLQVAGLSHAKAAAAAIYDLVVSMDSRTVRVCKLKYRASSTLK